MMFLSELRPAKGSKKNSKRIGRGPGSGYGKTAGKGHKGQNSRSGAKQNPGFEGGQMPLQRRLPKRGFKNPFRKEYEVVNVGDLGRFRAKSTVDSAALKRAGLIRSEKLPVKILAKGELKKSLTVIADAFSAKAKQIVEEAGGQVEVKKQ